MNLILACALFTLTVFRHHQPGQKVPDATNEVRSMDFMGYRRTQSRASTAEHFEQCQP